jgi:outer membrane protein assembly factor BamB
MNQKIKLYFAILLVCSSISKYSYSQTNQGWPQFRGSENNMIATGTNYPTEWNDSIHVLWTHDLTGAGWSSPIVLGDKIFVTSAFLEKAAPGAIQNAQPTPPPPPAAPGTQQGPPPPQAEDNSYKEEVYRWELSCFDLKSGKELWKQVAHNGNPGSKKHVGSTYACETPVTDGERVFAYFGMTGIYCYDLDGKLLWQKDLGTFKTLNGWGTGSSPVVYQGTLYIQVDNEESSFLVALDAVTGNEKWKVNRDEKTNYSTPVIWKNKIRTELVTTGKTVRSYDPANGNLNWQLKMAGEMAIPSPVYDSEHIYVGNAGGPGKKGFFYSVKAGADGNITPADSGLVSNGVDWTVMNSGISNPSPLLYKGLLYLLAARGGELTCLNATTGEQVYKEKVEKVGACWSSPWTYNDRIYFFDEKGITQVIQAGKEFKVLSQNKLDDKFWSSVAITKDAYIFRGVKKLFCVKK